jgi:acid phosphatase type 7
MSPRAAHRVALAALVLAGCGAASAENPTGGNWSALHPPERTRAILWAGGDGADGGAAARRLARRIGRGHPDWFLYLGDVYEGRSLAEFGREYGRVYGGLTRITAPTPGNHDWPDDRVGYDQYWTRAKGSRPPAYYAFSLAGWRILSLNSEVADSRRSRQLRWLRRELRARPGTCKLAFWHRPRYSAGLVHGDQRDTAPLWNAVRGRAALVLNGHEHDMQRMRPREGTIELVAGAGGHGRYPLDRAYKGLAFGDSSHYGALRLVLRPGRAAFAFVTSNGRKLDSGRVGCRTSAAAKV